MEAQTAATAINPPCSPQQFINEHQSELDEHTEKMQAGDETDPFLLILTPRRHAPFYNTGNADEHLREWLRQWVPIDTGHSEDYKLVATYCSVNRNPLDNFALRKVLGFEGASAADVHPLLLEALSRGCSLSETDDPMIENALDKCAAVALVVEDDELANQEKVRKIGASVSIGDLERLAAEFDADPLDGTVFGADEEAEEAIQTAGAAAAVEMMTMVGSKGLSARHVILIGCDDVNLAKTSRLTFFVALTRARQSLHLITSCKAGGTTRVHSFVDDLPADCCEYVVYKKTGSMIEHFADRSAWASRIDYWVRMARRR